MIAQGPELFKYCNGIFFSRGGYILEPECIEFWQGQSSRLHDRLLFRKLEEGEMFDSTQMKAGDDNWIIERLAP